MSGFKAEATVRGTSQAGPSYRYQGFYANIADAPTVKNTPVTNAVNNGSGLIRLTAAGHGLTTGDSVAVYGVTGTVEANGWWLATVIDANTIDLQGSTFTNAYVSGGNVTNRGAYYGFIADLRPTADRAAALSGTALHGDDIAAYVAVNNGTVMGGDAIYITQAGSIVGSGFYTGLSIAANVNYGLVMTGTIASYGIDMGTATFGASPGMRLPNNVPIVALNAAGTADVKLIALNASNQLQFYGPLAMTDGGNIILGTAAGTKIGTNNTTQKLGFFNANPVVQPSAVGSATGYTAGTTAGTFHTDDTYSGNVGTTKYTINGIVAALKNLGLIAA